MLGPGVEMLGQTIGGADIRELILLTQADGVLFIQTHHRAGDHLRVQRVGAKRGFHRLVVLRERPFRQFIERKQAAKSLLLHDKRPGVAPRRRSIEVRNIISDPLAAVPLDQHPLRIPRLAVNISRSAVIQHPTIERPRPGPSQRIAQARRIGVITIRHLVTLLGPAAGIDPARRRGAAVIAQQREAIEQLAFFRQQSAILIVEIRQRVAVVLFSHFCRFRVIWLLIAPAHFQQRFRALPAFATVQLAQTMIDPSQDFAIVARFPRCVLAFPVPLQPATGVGDRAIFFSKAGRRQTEDFGLNRGRVDIIRLAVVLPEGRGFGHQRVDNHHIFQLAEAANHFVFVREGGNRVKALADIAGDVAVIHHVEVFDNVVSLVPLR